MGFPFANLLTNAYGGDDFMKKVLLSADGEISVYSVLDEVADNLEKYC